MYLGHTAGQSQQGPTAVVTEVLPADTSVSPSLLSVYCLLCVLLHMIKVSDVSSGC